MGIAKKTDGRYVVGVGVDNANDYRGSAAYRDIYIQLTPSGATEKSEEYLTFLKDYAVNANALGEPIMPPSVNVWISNNGVTTAVEADDVSIDGNNYTICGIKWNGSTWDYSGAGQGKSGGGLPPYTSADKGKVLTIGDASPVETEVVVISEQTIDVTNMGRPDTPEYGAVIPEPDFSALTDMQPVKVFIDGVEHTATYNNSKITGNGVDIRMLANWLFKYSGWTEAGTHTISATATASVTPSVQTVIVPEQTGEFIADFGIGKGFTVSNPNLAFFQSAELGDTCEAIVGGSSYTLTYANYNGTLAFLDGSMLYALVPIYVDTEVEEVEFVSTTAAIHDTVTISATVSVPSVEPKWDNGGVTVTIPSDFILLFQAAMQSAITDILTNSRMGIVYAETENFAGTGLADFVTEVKNAAAASLEMKTIWVKGITDNPIAALYAQVLASGNIGFGFIVPSYEIGNPINRIFTIFVHVSGTVNGDGAITSVKARAGFQVWTSVS